MRFCRCEKPLHQSNPRKKACNRCGFNIPAPKPKTSAPIMHHCSRCLTDLPPGHSGAVILELSLLDEGLVCNSRYRFCSSCTPLILEQAVQWRIPSHTLSGSSAG